MRKQAMLLALIVVLLPSSASADGATFRDPDEQPFCESTGPCPDTDYMDFRRLTQGHGRTPRVLRHGIRTLERWKTKRLGGRHGTTIAIDFNTDDDGGTERGIRIRRKDGELTARMFRGKYLRKPVDGRIAVWRPDRRSVKVRFHARVLGAGVDEYRWRVYWWDRGVGCTGSCSTDFAPGRGWFEHVL